MKVKIPVKYFLSLFFILLSFSSFAQFRVIGYLPTWLTPASDIMQVDLNKMTHINIAFANPTDNTGTGLSPEDGMTAGDVATVVNTCHNKGVKVFMSIGGASASASQYNAILGNPSNLSIFVNTIKSYIISNNLDGVDVDIEGNVLDGTNVTASQYQTFVTKLDTAMSNHGKQMSAALATWFADYVTNAAAAKFDWVNVMSYDAYGPWSGPGDHSPYALAVSDFQYWKNTKGVLASKLVIGVPFYGYGWGTYVTTDELSYCTIINTYTNAQNTDSIGSSASGNMISYNGLPTMILKTKYALANASGIMIWQITEDCATSDNRSLLRAIDSLIHPVTTGITQSQLAQEQMNVFPNPSMDRAQVQLNLPASSNGSLLLCDLSGNVLQELAKGTLDAQAQYTLSLSSYSNGMYLLKLVTDEGILVKKISKR